MYYNQTVVLQCLTSGVVSPVLIIRKVDHATVVVGGGLAEGAKGVPDSYCPPGEVCGDPVSQLHKIAFEVYDAAKSVAPPPGSPGQTGSFLSCMGEKVNTYRPVEGRTWTTPGNSPDSSPPGAPDSPLLSTPPPGSAGGINGDYFTRIGSDGGIPPSPPDSDYPPSSDGGRVKRGKRNSVSSTTGPIVKGTTKGRRRQNSQSSTSSGRISHSNENGASSGAVWQVDIGETSVWTIVGTGQFLFSFRLLLALVLKSLSSRSSSVQLLRSACPVRLTTANQFGITFLPDPFKGRYANPRRRKVPDARSRCRGAQVELCSFARGDDEAQSSRFEIVDRIRRELLEGRPCYRLLWLRTFPTRRDSMYRSQFFPFSFLFPWQRRCLTLEFIPLGSYMFTPRESSSQANPDFAGSRRWCCISVVRLIPMMYHSSSPISLCLGFTVCFFLSCFWTWE